MTSEKMRIDRVSTPETTPREVCPKSWMAIPPIMTEPRVLAMVLRVRMVEIVSSSSVLSFSKATPRLGRDFLSDSISEMLVLRIIASIIEHKNDTPRVKKTAKAKRNMVELQLPSAEAMTTKKNTRVVEITRWRSGDEAAELEPRPDEVAGFWAATSIFRHSFPAVLGLAFGLFRAVGCASTETGSRQRIEVYPQTSEAVVSSDGIAVGHMPLAVSAPRKSA